MPTDEYQCETCSFGQNGAVCALHGVEVERRRNSDSLLKKLTEAVHTLGNTVDSLSSFKYMALGVALIGMMLITGAYYFTADTKADLVQVDISNSTKLEIVSGQVSALTTAVAVTEARHAALLTQLESLSTLMRAKVVREDYKVNDPRGMLRDDRNN